MAAFSSLSWRWLLLAALLYAGLVAWYAWPLPLAVSSAFVGEPGGDANQYLWNAWNFQRQVALGHDPMRTPLLLYPPGSSLWLHTYTPVLGVLNLAVRQPYQAINLGLLLSFVISGVGAAWLAGRWVRQPLLCVLVGFAFAFSPYKLAHWPEHYHLLLTAAVPFFVAAYLAAWGFEAGRWPHLRNAWALAVATGLLLLTLLSDYYTTAGLLYFAGGYAAWWRLQLGAISWRRWQPWVVLVAVLALGHFASRGLALLGADDFGGLYWGGDLGTYLVPPLHSRWLGTAASRAFWHQPRLPVQASPENVAFLGYLVPGLVLASLVARARRPAQPGALPPLPTVLRPWPALGLLFVLLTIPELRWAGHDLLRLPTSLVHFVPFFNNIRCPTRLVMMAALLLPLLAALGLDQWLASRAAVWRWSVPLLLLAGVFVEYQIESYPLVRAADVPRAYRLAGQQPGAVLFALPLGLGDGGRQVGVFSPAQLRYQTQHGKALRGAYLSRLSAATFATFAHEPVLRTLLLAQRHPDSLALVPGPTPAELAAFGRRYGQPVFVVEPHYYQAPAHQLLRQWLLPRGYREQVVADSAGCFALLLPALGPAVQ
ncbi:hypothetical protein HHL22_17540 [Hymenobacter sp. RP-2-7]|uniref:Glycosyltransferase RgtA/B/C/D-like domain-containing protein n=1 Tax=Hymenobacter polaris TaxID=2682546 RepID=A0A7Y0AGN6_9BACT|nr:hypothetical protein [Hymenobacter polaris]NML67013.1 hypothetical protein [Hymenobacter polaris]